MAGRNILLTGLPGTGKTTIIQRVADVLDGPTLGLYTREIREKGVRSGFEVVSLLRGTPRDPRACGYVEFVPGGEVRCPS